METSDFFQDNKRFFSVNTDWKNFLCELEHLKRFIDQLSFLVFGRDMGIMRSSSGLRPIHTNQILQSATQTVQSMILCAEYGNIADVHILMRKLRDDLLFYLYIIVVGKNSDLLSTNNLSKEEKYIDDWAQNNLSRLNIKKVIDSIIDSDECKDLSFKFNLHDELKKIGHTLNNYTHGNGNLYYNRPFTYYSDHEISQLTAEMIHMLKYILIAFVFCLTLLHPGYIMSSDYIDALELSMTPEEGSQYWVAPFISDFLNDNSDLLGENALNYLRERTSMEI